MEKFFVRGRDRCQSATQFHAITFYEIVRTKPDPAFHRFHIVRIRIPVAMFEQPAFVETLHDCWRRIEVCQGVLDSFFPVSVSKVGAERNSPASPTERRESAHFEKKIAIFLA